MTIDPEKCFVPRCGVKSAIRIPWDASRCVGLCGRHAAMWQKSAHRAELRKLVAERPPSQTHTISKSTFARWAFTEAHGAAFELDRAKMAQAERELDAWMEEELNAAFPLGPRATPSAADVLALTD